MAFEWSNLDTLVAERKTAARTANIWMSSHAHILTWTQLKISLQADFQDRSSERELHKLLSNKKKGRLE